MELRDVCAASYFGTEAASAQVLGQLLSASGQVKMGAFELHAQAEGSAPRHVAVIFKAKVAADLSPERLLAVTWAVAETADQMEATLTDSDTF